MYNNFALSYDDDTLQRALYKTRCTYTKRKLDLNQWLKKTDSDIVKLINTNIDNKNYRMIVTFDTIKIKNWHRILYENSQNPGTYRIEEQDKIRDELTSYCYTIYRCAAKINSKTTYDSILETVELAAFAHINYIKINPFNENPKALADFISMYILCSRFRHPYLDLTGPKYDEAIRAGLSELSAVSHYKLLELMCELLQL